MEMNFAYCMAVKELARQNSEQIAKLANSFLEGHITEKELCCDIEFQSLLLLKNIRNIKGNGNRKEAV
jgi:hypothetical protein